MSIFLSIAGLMVAVALAWLLPTLLKEADRRGRSDI